MKLGHSDGHLDEDEEPEPSHSVQLPRDVLVSDPFDKSVRVSRAGVQREKVWVIKLTRPGKEEALMTLGASTREDAAKWKVCIETTARSSTASSPSLQKSGSESLASDNPKSMKRGASMWGGPDDKWQVVENHDGVVIEGEKEFTKEFPSLRAKAVVQASPKEVFELIMDDSRRALWDDGVEKNEVLRLISETSSIVYVQMRPIWIGPIYTGPRDLVLIRYWRQDSDNTYVITWQSVEDPELSPARAGYTRGKIFAMSFTISPIEGHPEHSAVRLFCHADPGPPFSLMPSSVLQKWLYPFVTRIVGIKKALEKSKSIVQAPGLSGGDVDENIPPPSPALSPPPMVRASSNPGLIDLNEVNTLKLGSFNHSEWCETPKEEPYTIRGKNYLEDGIKYKCTTQLFHTAAAELYKLTEPTPHCAARSDSPVWKIRETYPDRPVFVLQFMLPGPPFYSLAIYAVGKKGVIDDPEAPFTRLWTDFVEGTDEYRSSVFKLIPRVPHGAYMVRRTVG